MAINKVSGQVLSTNAALLGYAERTSAFQTNTTNSYVDVTSLSVTVTVPAGGRKVKVTGYFPTLAASGSAATLYTAIYEGATCLQQNGTYMGTATGYVTSTIVWVGTPTAGSHTYKLAVKKNNGTTLTADSGAEYPSFILVELI